MKSRTLSLTSGLVTDPGTWTRDEESLSGANNADLSSAGILAQRRGFSNNTLNSFSGGIWAAYSSPVLERDVGAGGVLLATGTPGTAGSLGFRVGLRNSTFAAITGTWASDTASRPKLATGPNGVDVITTWLTGGHFGVLTLDYVARTAQYLGVPRGIGLDRLVTTTDGTAGWLASNYSVRYAVVFSKGDPTVNGSQLGSPGMTTVFNNTTVNPVDVKVRLLLPVEFGTVADALTADEFWVQVYRSASQPSSQGEPPSELALVYQQKLASADVSAGYVQFIDIVPDIARGANLYTNILSGEDGAAGRGFLNSNEPPPAGKDVANWADCLWLGSLQDMPSQEVQLVAVGGTGLVAGDTFTIGGVAYTAVAGAPAANEFQIVSSGTASFNQRETALNLVDAINRSSSNDDCYGFYVAGVVGQPGKMVFLARVMTNVLAAATSRAAAFRIGTESANLPRLNAVAFSKPLQPHAWPTVNEFELGRGDAEVMRLVPYRDSLFVFKQDGLFRVTGTDYRSFEAREFDLTFRLIGRESVVALDDGIYAWGVRGLARITDGGVEYIDAPIRNEVLGVQSGVLNTTMESFSFAMARPADGVVVFFYPQFDPSEATDTDNIIPCVAGFAWHERTRTWSRWILQGNGLAIGYSCAVTNVTDGLTALGVFQQSPASGCYLHNERRTYTTADFEDPDMTDAANPSMGEAKIPIGWQWRSLSSDALGSAQWLRARFDQATSDATRSVVAAFSVTIQGDSGVSETATISVGTVGAGPIPRTSVAPIPREASRSHALSLSVTGSPSGLWLISATVDFRPFSEKAIR